MIHFIHEVNNVLKQAALMNNDIKRTFSIFPIIHHPSSLCLFPRLRCTEWTETIVAVYSTHSEEVPFVLLALGEGDGHRQKHSLHVAHQAPGVHRRRTCARFVVGEDLIAGCHFEHLR